MMKNVISILLAVVVLFAFAVCGTAAPVKAVPTNITQDLSALDADAQATAAAQAVITTDAAAVTAAQAAVTAAQTQQTTDTGALITAQQAEAAQLAQTIADIQAAYGTAPLPSIKVLARTAATYSVGPVIIYRAPLFHAHRLTIRHR